MKIRCPACGSSISLDSLIGHDDARELIIELFKISDDLTRSALRYLALFRPDSKDLSFARVSKLLGQIIPDIQGGQIIRNRHTFTAPREAWIWAFDKCVEARDLGKLKTPLSTHGFLYETLKFYQPSLSPIINNNSSVTSQPVNSKLRQGVAALANWAEDGDFLKAVVGAGLAKLSVLNLANKPAALDLIAVANIWREELLNHRSDWQIDLDKKRIEKAFQYLGSHAEKWPNPKDLIQVLNPRPTQPKLDRPPLTQEQKEAARRKLDELKNRIG